VQADAHQKLALRVLLCSISLPHYFHNWFVDFTTEEKRKKKKKELSEKDICLD